MKKRILILVLVAGILTDAIAQTITIKGVITDIAGKPLRGANVTVSERMAVTTSDNEGKFQILVHGSLPVQLNVSMMGYESRKIEITGQVADLLITMVESINILSEVTVRAPSRIEEKIMQSPVSIEWTDAGELENAPSDDYFKALETLKGVDMISSGINFQILNTRGFARTNNARFVQLLDGMDLQSAAINIPYGSANLPSILDLDNIELMPGSASALYGPNAFNGIMLVTSKNPFKYEGLSAEVKLGFNHFGSNAGAGPQIMPEVALRYAKAFKNKFAFKINLYWMQAEDWQARNYSDKNAALKGDLPVNPAYDGVNLYGDDGGINLGLLRSSQDLINALADSTGLSPEIIAPYVASLPAVNVNRTGYPEYSLADYHAKSLKGNAGIYYKLTNDVELSYQFHGSDMTSIFTAAQRYSLKNAYNMIHRVGARAENWSLTAYASFENSGDSYVMDFSGYAINNAYLNNSSWFGTYAATFAGALLQANVDSTGSPLYNPGVINAILADPAAAGNLHIYARNTADAGRWEPGSEAFEHALDSINRLILPEGSRFYDRSRFYHAEGQYDFRKEIHFLQLLVGANWRMYDLRSNGTIFADSRDNPIRINEYGAYAEASKKFLEDRLRLGLSLRYDKSQNFNGQFTPRIAGVYTFLGNHNIRASYQTGFRNPTTQDQYIDLNMISSRVIGGLQQFYDKYRLGEWTYTLESVNDFTQSVITGHPDPSLLVPYTSWTTLKPEQVQVIEAGYKGLLFNRLMIDAYYYFNKYKNFISSAKIRQAQDANGNPANPLTDPTQAALYGLLTGDAGNTFQLTTNNPEILKSEGIAFGMDYMIYKGYRAALNYSWNHLITKDIADKYINNYNTPEHMVNLVFGNSKAIGNLGFSLAWRWQDSYTWNSSFVQDGPVPAINTLDAQISYTFRELKTILKIGGSDVLNNKYVSFYGGPTIGAIYYISLIFDESMLR